MLIRNIIVELSRELEMRRFVFPRLIKQGKLTDPEAADRIERLAGAMFVLQTLFDADVQTTDQLLLRLTPSTERRRGPESESPFEQARMTGNTRALNRDSIRSTLPLIKGGEHV